MTDWTEYKLDALQPDNLLAFLALLGVLRSLETSLPQAAHRVAWTIDSPPIRPLLCTSACPDEASFLAAVAAGVNSLVRSYGFRKRKDLVLDPEEAATVLADARSVGGSTADIWSALISDAVVARDGKKAEPTPLCMMFGQGHQHFLERLETVPATNVPPPRGKGRRKVAIDEYECLREALFGRWARLDNTRSFRWDHQEDVRYAMRATDPTDSKTKDGTQHGANRLAAIGLAALPVVPRFGRGGLRLAAPGGDRDHLGRFTFSWPVWREPITLATVLSLLNHPNLDDQGRWAPLGIAELRRTTRVSSGKYMNVTRAQVVQPD